MVNATRAAAIAVRDNRFDTKTGLLTGAGIGAIGGGLYGYFSKPWLNNGELTDKFVKQVYNTCSEQSVADLELGIKDLQKLAETGDWESISKRNQKNFKLNAIEPEKIGAGFVEENKAFAKKQLEDLGGKPEDVIKEHKKMMEASKKLFNIKIDKNISEEKLIKIVAENYETFGIEKNAGQSIDDLAKAYVKNNGVENIKVIIEGTQKLSKELYTEAFEDLKKGTIKKSTEELGDILKKTINKFKLKTAGKWGAILASGLGLLGLGIGSCNKNKVDTNSMNLIV